MFKKILVANRGEIACRIIRSAKAMGISTVAVYSDADRRAPHVALADEAVHIGGSPASESYLLGERILEACRATGAEAVHPGYGFLSERASFCEMLEGEAIVFIGPKPRAIRAMGDKIESKLFAQDAGVNIVPGHLGVIASVDQAALIAGDIGYPVMIKASAGGGGKGMRIAWNERECRDGFDRARSEARSSFGDDRVFIEKFIEEPRHIEIQVLADAHGNTIYLGERECSIQRRNQKVVEEAPSPFIDEKTRRAMGEQSVALAKAVDYQSAGTVEFIVDKDRNFYFLEMNTRLQVEHPVTELVTGLDIVECMIRIAAGEALPIRQEDVALNGWAIESRIYAEDPARNFLPSIGRLTRYRPPREGASDAGPHKQIRNDTGVTEGSEITLFYDPMIAKLCTWAPDREQAIDTMSEALSRFELDGIAHNIPFLASLMRHPRWREGRLSTSFIADEFPDGFTRPEPSRQTLRRAAVLATAIEISRKTRLDRHADRLRRHHGGIQSRWAATIEGEHLAVEVERRTVSNDGASLYVMTVDGKTVELETVYRPGASLWEGTVDGERESVQVRERTSSLSLFVDGSWLDVSVMSPRIAELSRLMPKRTPPDTSKLLLCPMPGLVVSIAVEEGDEVKAGDTLAIVEAMKMENILRAERDGVVSKLNASTGDSLAVDAVIMEFA